jgi:Galactose oxidase, central domain
VLVVGENTGGSCTVYDPGSGLATAAVHMITPRWVFTITPLRDGRVLLAGGMNDNRTIASAELFDLGSP